MHIFNSRSGLFRFSDGTYAVAYSGSGNGINNPALEAVPSIGPIPAGMWDIGGPYDSARVGPYALPLIPVGHDAHGRSAFRIHGDSNTGYRIASRGCIIMSPSGLRRKIWQSGEHTLKVTSE